MRSLEAAQAEQQRNREAESAHVRRTVWGESGDQGLGQSEDDMGDTILGDVTHPTPVIIPPHQSNSGMTVVMLALGMAAGSMTGGLAGYLLGSQAEKPGAQGGQQLPNFDDESVSIGLGKIEDFLKEK